MDIDEWWPKVDASTQDRLIANTGDAVSADVMRHIARAGGVVTDDARWVGTSGLSGLYLSDEATDWIDAIVNGETTRDR